MTERPQDSENTNSSRRGFLGGGVAGLVAGLQTSASVAASPPEGKSATTGISGVEQSKVEVVNAVNSRLFSFCGGVTGDWMVTSVRAICGETLPDAERLHIHQGIGNAHEALSSDTKWCLRGVTSNDRYVTRPEKALLVAKQAPLGRATATHAALIPIRKSAAWWAMTQDERRALFEEESQHIKIGMDYLPAIARRLHHCRDLESKEPFDFLTFFDFAPGDEPLFDRMLERLRSTREWSFVDREVDIRLKKVTPT